LGLQGFINRIALGYSITGLGSLFGQGPVIAGLKVNQNNVPIWQKQAEVQKD